MPNLREITGFLDRLLCVGSYEEPEEAGGLVRPGDRPVRRLGLALDPWPGMEEWVEGERLDALFLHRPWELEPDVLPEGVGVFSYHLPFDEKLTLGFNLRLAHALGMVAVEPFGQREGRPLGMAGRVPSRGFFSFCEQIEQVFGGRDKCHAGAGSQVQRIAVVGAMTEPLINKAAEREVDCYVTGQWRAPARYAVDKTRIAVITVGHHRSEAWGVRALANLLEERWRELRCVVQLGNSR